MVVSHSCGVVALPSNSLDSRALLIARYAPPLLHPYSDQPNVDVPVVSWIRYNIGTRVLNDTESAS